MKGGIGRRPSFGAIDYNKSPLLVIWETTRSCELACLHCRAAAMPGRDPLELTTAEGKDLMDQVFAMGTPIFILSGGDPLNRPDLEELIRHGKERGLRVGTIPAATGNLTKERIASLAAAGVDQVAFSLDAPDADAHDAFRRVPGAFQKTIDGCGWAKEAGIPIQVNTCFGAWNIRYLEKMIELVTGLGVVFWEVFFVIPTGRGDGVAGITGAQFEEVFERLARLSREVDFHVKLTEAQHFKRFTLRQATPSDGPAVNSGKGFMFVDHRGDICPSGFLPLPVGNVRRDALVDVYRESKVFRELRDHSLLKGKCGECEYRRVCGGSRARAHAVTGDYLASDPSCAYHVSGKIVPAGRGYE